MWGKKSLRARPLLSLLGQAVLGGILVAAIALPPVALLGLVSNITDDDFSSLPAALREPSSAQSTLVYANDGKTLITAFYDEDRRNVELKDVAPVMRQAIVAAEDTRFFEHGGIDVKGMVRALVSDTTSGRAEQGASTLTMQYVRNVLKTDSDSTVAERASATDDTLARKVREIRYAVALEKGLSKQEILERYLNIAYFGDGAYGISAASQAYFGKAASKLTLPEAALLAGLVQSPDTYNPVGHDQAPALDRRSYVLDSMAKMGAITTAQADAANAQPIGLNPHTRPNDCTAVVAGHNDWGFFCDYFRQWWDTQAQFGATVEERDNALTQGGYTVITSLDPSIQARALKESLSVYGYGRARSLPMAVVQPGTGRVLAMAVNRHYSLAANPSSHPKYPNTVNQLIAGGDGVTGYQAGSTFKMFTMLAAIEEGLPLNTGFNAPSRLVTQWKADGTNTCGGYWCPENENPSWMDGYRTMWTGFGRSVNTYFVWLEQQIGPQRAVDMAKRLGITFRADSDAALAKNASSWGSFTLGVADTTPLDLANAYATVAAKGVYCQPLPVISITDSAGHAVAAANPSCGSAISADVAAAAADAARCPVGQESSYGRCNGGTAEMVSDIVDGRPIAGKTGSAENNATETFVGFTPELAVAAIAANPDDPSDYVGSDVSASVDEAVARTIAAALSGTAYQDFPRPDPDTAFGSFPLR